jgi:hypothetical protein
MNPIPSFKNEFLEEVAESLRKRRKSLKHRSRQILVNKTYEMTDGKQEERLDAFLESWSDAQLQMVARSNRFVWLSGGLLTKKGWTWNWTYEGRLLGAVSARAAVEALEKTFDLAFSMEEARIGELTAVWKPLLAKGPVEIR